MLVKQTLKDLLWVHNKGNYELDKPKYSIYIE